MKKIDNLIERPAKVYIDSKVTKEEFFNDEVLYIPKIDTENISTKIVTKKEKSEGTEDILEKLKQIR